MAEQITGVIIARNEESDLPGCLEAWKEVCPRIILVDDDSTDNTRAIGHAYGCDVIPTAMEPGTGFSGLRNTGLEKVDTTATLVFDADERPSATLVKAIRAATPDRQAYQLTRQNHAFGHTLSHGRFGNDHQIRLFPSYIRYAGLVHEMPQIPAEMEVGMLEGHVDHFTYSSLAEYFRKMHQYAEQTSRQSQARKPLRTTLKDQVSCMLKRSGYRDGWPAGIITLGDIWHDLMVLNHQSKESLTGDAYIDSPEQRAFDIVGATLLGLGSLPMLGVATVAMSIEQRSFDVLFPQPRFGHGGKPLSVWKLRTIAGPDYSDLAEEGGPVHFRATKLGQLIRETAIDEAPQLPRVILGGMHLAGIRPPTTRTLEQRQKADPILFEEWLYWAQRCPGIVGPGQLYAHEAGHYREDSPVAVEIMRRDIRGRERASLANDFRDVAATPLNVIKDTIRDLGDPRFTKAAT